MRRVPSGLTLLLLGALLCAHAAAATDGSGTVTVPIDVYNTLVNAGQGPAARPAPAGYALGNARLDVRVDASDERRRSAQVSVRLTVRILEDDWVLVPVLPAGTAVDSATVDGAAVQLISTPAGLGWATKGRGTHVMALSYRIDALASKAGWSLSLPVPASPSTALTAVVPGPGHEIAVIPAANVRTSSDGDSTTVLATLPATMGALLTWSAPADSGIAAGRSLYRGVLVDDAFRFRAVWEVDLLGDGSERFELLPIATTLSELTVDGKPAPILVADGHFVTPLRGRGRHRVEARFEVPVTRTDGPPRIDLALPRVPVSQFELTLPGDQVVSSIPAAAVDRRRDGDSTIATVHVALNDNVRFQWSEAVPDEGVSAARTSATVYHSALADEGVLYLTAWVRLEVSRGAVSRVELAIPASVEVDRISAPSGAVVDWRVDGKAGEARTATVFLDREIREQLMLEVHYDLSLDAPRTAVLPLLAVSGAQRESGMVALLAGRELGLEPVAEPPYRIGADQLPPFLLDGREETVAHAFKYGSSLPEIEVRAVAPQREPGRYDAVIDTLVSLGEVSQKGAVMVEIDVKTGSLTELTLGLPAGVNVLSLTGPSVREYDLSEEGSEQTITIAFNREMTGRFRLDLAWERLLTGEAEIPVPLTRAEGAEVAQGHLAVEALDAVEVRTAVADELTPIEVDELPRRLVLRTSHPVLLAFKYAGGERSRRLVLAVERHRLMDVQEATIDRAQYHTLFTRDGLAVTRASFWVRNSREQFLALELPEGAEVWSAFVNGRPERPALPAEGTSENSVLLKMIHSTDGFPVEITWAVDRSALGSLGALEASLPTPGILATHSRWDVYLPSQLSYRSPKTNMEVVALGAAVGADQLARALVADAESGARAPLHIEVPARGTHFAFEKLYANRSDDGAWITLPYATRAGAFGGTALSLFAVMLLGLGLVADRLLPGRLPIALRRGAAPAGIVLLGLTLGLLGVDPRPALVLAVLLAGLMLLGSRRRSEAVQSA